MSTHSSQPVRVRRMEARDLETVADLFAEDMQALGVGTPARKLRELVQTVYDDDGKTAMCWVAEVDEAAVPVGALLANFYHSIKFGGRSVWIEGLYVRPSHRRHGIGRLLVDYVVDWADESGLLGVDLEAYQGNTPAAVLYRSLGFCRLGRERFSLHFQDAD